MNVCMDTYGVAVPKMATSLMATSCTAASNL